MIKMAPRGTKIEKYSGQRSPPETRSPFEVFGSLMLLAQDYLKLTRWSFSRGKPSIYTPRRLTQLNKQDVLAIAQQRLQAKDPRREGTEAGREYFQPTLLRLSGNSQEQQQDGAGSSCPLTAQGKQQLQSEPHGWIPFPSAGRPPSLIRQAGDKSRAGRAVFSVAGANRRRTHADCLSAFP